MRRTNHLIIATEALRKAIRSGEALSIARAELFYRAVYDAGL